MVGRNRFFFPTQGQGFDLGGGLEAWKGFYSSVRPSHNQLMVNVNGKLSSDLCLYAPHIYHFRHEVCTTAFYKPINLAEAITSFVNSTFGARPNAFVKGVRVRTTHLGYKKTIKTISSMNANQHKFQAAEFGREVTVAEYFKLSM